MKPNPAKFFTLFVIVCLWIAPKSMSAQDLANFLNAAPEDAAALFSAYAQPAIEGVSFGMTGGWYTTAKAHKSFGVDIGVSLNTVFLPSSKMYFDPNNLALKTISSFENTTNPGSGAPSIMGPEDETEYIFSYDPDGNGSIPNQNFAFPGPQGLDIGKRIGIGEAPVPVPMFQLGVGIIKNTDLKLRFVPEQSVGSSKIKMLGIGVLHDIKQHISGIKLMPFDLSVLVAYNNVSGNVDFTNSDDSDQIPNNTNGVMNYSFNSWIMQALISKKISVLTIYGGVGYQLVKTKIDVLGDYLIESSSSPLTFAIKDPVAIDFKNNGFKLNGGIRLKFGPFYLNGEYTVAKYNSATVGLGFSFK